MLLEKLKQFDWMNEPANVRFDEKGMNVQAKYRTDFWCCSRYNFRKDDGHFFFCYVLGDFCCDLNWEFQSAGLFDQCGIMLRTDVNNWFKCSIMYEKDDVPMLATSLTVDGYSDLATIPLPFGVKRVWYRLKNIKAVMSPVIRLMAKAMCNYASFILFTMSTMLKSELISVLRKKKILWQRYIL